VDDLAQWLRRLDGCPSVTTTHVMTCTRDAHGDEPGTWFYVEADAAGGVARVRCLGCGHARPLLDSETHWTYPSAASCRNCFQSIFEVAAGLHVESDSVSWVALAVRCVECGEMRGVADFVVEDLPTDEVLATLR
jgi:ferredoxin-like protein FixX